MNTEEVLNLVAAQRRTSLKHLAVVGVPLLIFMTALKLFPSIGGWRIGTLPPVPWLVLGPVILFSIVAVAAVHERRARRIEDTWSQGHRETAR